MTISWRRWTRPDTIIGKNVSSGGAEPMPRVYRLSIVRITGHYERGGHVDLRMAKRVYRRKPTDVIPLPQVSKKPNKHG
jgi:hypothetical protein